MAKPLQYVDSKVLPQDKPAGCPHLIQDFDEETNITNLRLADGTATVLYYLNPEILKIFLDVKAPNIELGCKTESPQSSLVMARYDNSVMVSTASTGDTILIDWPAQCAFFSEHAEQTTQHMQCIDSTGEWKTEEAMTDSGRTANKERGENPKAVEDAGALFASQLLRDKIWESPKTNWTVRFNGELRNDLLDGKPDEQSGSVANYCNLQ